MCLIQPSRLKFTRLVILPGIYYAFWCHPGLQYFYMLTVLGFILTGLIFRNTFNKDENLVPRLTEIVSEGL